MSTSEAVARLHLFDRRLAQEFLSRDDAVLEIGGTFLFLRS
ncbi:MAG: hypothetical protein WCT12_00895 [Verrucomicrobiota bacterium]